MQITLLFDLKKDCEELSIKLNFTALIGNCFRSIIIITILRYITNSKFPSG